MITRRGIIAFAAIACAMIGTNLYAQRMIIDYFEGSNIVLYTSEYRLYFKDDVSAGLALQPRSVVETGSGTKIVFRIEPEGTIVKLGENSTIKVVSLSGYEGSDRNEIKLISGVVRVIAAVPASGTAFVLSGQIADVSTKNGDFGMVVRKKEEESVVVLKGEVEYSGSRKDSILLAAGEMANDFDSIFGEKAATPEYKELVSNLDFAGSVSGTPAPSAVPEAITGTPSGTEPQTPQPTLEPTIVPTIEPTPTPAPAQADTDTATPVPEATPVQATETSKDTSTTSAAEIIPEKTDSESGSGASSGTEGTAGTAETATGDGTATGEDPQGAEIIQQSGSSGDFFLGAEAGLGATFPYFLTPLPPDIKAGLDALPLFYILLARGYAFCDIYIKPIPNLGIGVESGFAYITMTMTILGQSVTTTFADIPVRGFIRFGNKAIYAEAFGGYYFNIIAQGFDTTGWEGGLRVGFGGTYIECSYVYGAYQYLRFGAGYALGFLPGQL